MSALHGVAIVGMAGRWPGATTVSEFWSNLMNGVESISHFTPEELRAAGVPERLLTQPGYVGASAVLRGVDRFDAGFFGLTPREAALLDPQGRLFMECVWEAFEHAGYVPSTFDGLVGVFGGVGASRYFMRHLLPSADQLDGAGAYQAMIANDKDFLPAWVSYKLNLRGPSVAVQTSCSTSLVAVHMACQSLLTYQSDFAVAGGVSLGLDETAGYVYQEGGILSPDGHCRPYDARAKGTVHGSGAGVVALRRLEDALADGAAIVAVIRGSAVNNDGAAKVGFTAPGLEGQVEVIGMAQAVADVEPDSIGFVEGHGTATPLGDPIEVAALSKVFRRQTSRRGFCALGSVKSNVGHLDAAAGVTGLIKAALAVAHGRIPPTLHFEQPNPQIELSASPFFVNAEPREWPEVAGPRRAGVSSFGIGGTNVHAVIEQAPQRRDAGPSRGWQIVPLSARSDASLERVTTTLADAMAAEEADHVRLPDVAYTLAVGRTPFRHRRIVVARDVDEALDAIETHDPEHVFTGVAGEQARPVTMMFPGQGSQYAGMACALYADEPVFRQEFDRCASLLRASAGLDVSAVLCPPTAALADATAALNRTEVCQPALFVVEYALARLLAAMGVTAHSYIGHSVGEYVAACLSGVLSLDDALIVVSARGRLVAGLPAGAMLAVSMPEAEVKTVIDPTQVSVAVVNSPNACVVAGSPEAIAACAATLDGRGVLHRRLQVSHAFHSHMMEPILAPFREVLSQVQLQPPHTPFISNVTGTWIRADEATDREYWVRQLRRTVYFSDGLREVLKDPNRVAIEVGPGRTLQGLALQQRAHGSRQEVVATLPDARESRPSADTLAVAVGRLWMAGADVDWPRYFAAETRHRLHLPTAPFERERHWIERPASTQTPVPHDRQAFPQWFYTPVWTQATSIASPVVADQGGSWMVVMPSEGSGAPAQVPDEVRLLEAIADALRTGGRTVSVRRPGDPLDVTAVTARIVCMPSTFEEALSIVRAVTAASTRQPRIIEMIQTGVHVVTGDEDVRPERAAVLGVCTVAPQEDLTLTCRQTDVVMPTDDEGRTRLVDQLLHEFAGEPTGDQVAYRGRMRWTRTYRRVQIPDRPATRIRPNGVYWITGGTGGIGMSLARHLAATYQARLVLTSRTTPSPGSRAGRAIRDLEAMGSQVRHVQADVTRLDDMRRVATLIDALYGELHGVIHAAGVPGGRLAALETPEGAAAIMAPKVMGAAHLATALGDVWTTAPDFVLYCSSLAVPLGGVGQSAYAAANAVLDGRARQQQTHSRPVTVSLNWDQWREVGMAASLADANAIGPDEGARAFEVALTLGLSEVAVSTRDLATRPRVHDVTQAPGGSGSVHARPALSVDYVRPGTAAEKALADLWQDVLGIGSVGVDDNFFELGGDSLSALRLVALYRDRTSVSVPVTELYASPTIRRFLKVARESLRLE